MERKTTCIKSLGDAGSGVAVFATLGALDRDGDVTLPGAFGEQVVKVLPAHDWGHVPLGKARIYERGSEAVAEFSLNLDIEAARDWYAALKFDLAGGTPVQEWSYGFEIRKSSLGQHEGKAARFLEQLKVFEVSPVVLGAGVGTRTLAVKGHGRQLEEQIESAIAEIGDLAGRVAELKAMREAEGRGLAEGRRAQLGLLKAALQRLGVELGELTSPEVGRKLFGAALRRELGR